MMAKIGCDPEFVDGVGIDLEMDDYKAVLYLLQYGIKNLIDLIEIIGTDEVSKKDLDALRKRYEAAKQPVTFTTLEPGDFTKMVKQIREIILTKDQTCKKVNKTEKQSSTKDKAKDKQEKPESKKQKVTKETKHTAPKEDRLLSMPEVLEKLRPYGITSQRIYHRMGTGKFPKSVKQGSRVYWRLSDIEAWEKAQ